MHTPEAKPTLNRPQLINFFVPKSQHKLQKMTRILVDEQVKTMNRIRLFKNTTAKMIHEKEKEIIGMRKRMAMRNGRKSECDLAVHPIMETIEKRPVPSRNLRSQCSLRSLKSVTSSRTKEVNQLAQSRRLSRKINQQLIEKSKQKQLRRNLKSAKMIRSARQNIKSAKEHYFEWKINTVKQDNKQMWDRDYNAYLEKYKKIEKLKRMELFALTEWKKNKETIEQLYNQVQNQ